MIRTGLLTPLPRTPSFLLGVTGHRGEVLPVMDLLRFLGKGEARVGAADPALHRAPAAATVVGVVADAVLGLRRIPVADVLPPPLGGDAAAEHLLGVYRGATPRTRLRLLNFTKLLQSARQRAVAR